MDTQTVAQQGPPSKSVRQEIRDWWRSEREAEGAIDLKEGSKRAIAELGENLDLVKRWFAETAYSVVYEVGMHILSDERSDVVKDARGHGAAAQLRQSLEAQPPPDYNAWMERDPASGEHIPLKEMLKEQVLAAAFVRHGRGMEELRREAFLKFVAGRLGAGQRVGDVWTDNLLTDLMNRINVTSKASLKGIKPIVEATEEVAADD